MRRPRSPASSTASRSCAGGRGLDEPLAGRVRRSTGGAERLQPAVRRARAEAAATSRECRHRVEQATLARARSRAPNARARVPARRRRLDPRSLCYGPAACPSAAAFWC